MEKKKILIVDDEVGFTKIIKLNLDFRGGYEVRTENDSLNAFAVTKEFKPDLILLDIKMPGMDGGEVLRQLKADEATKDIPVIFVTALLKKEDQPSADGTIDGQPFLLKPVGTKALVECIKKILSKSDSSSSPTI